MNKHKAAIFYREDVTDSAKLGFNTEQGIPSTQQHLYCATTAVIV